MFERDLDQPAQRIRQAELLGRPGRYIEELRAADEHGEAAGPRDRDVEAVAGIEKVEIARCVGRARCRHRVDRDGSLLALELVHRTDADALAGEPFDGLTDQLDMGVVRCDHEDVRARDPPPPTIPVRPFPS